MSYKIATVVLGQPKSTFPEIIVKCLKMNVIKKTKIKLIFIGSEKLLFMTVPIYLLFIGTYYLMVKKAGYLNHHDLKMRSHKISKGYRLISSSTMLKFILLIHE